MPLFDYPVPGEPLGVSPDSSTSNHQDCSPYGVSAPEIWKPSVSMSLLREPISDRATLATQAVASRIYYRRRPSGRPTKRYIATVGAATRDLLKAASHTPYRPCYRPMAAADFSDRRIGYRAFKQVLDDLELSRFVKIDRGYADASRLTACRGVVTRIHPTKKLIAFLDVCGVRPDSIDDDFGSVSGWESVPRPIRLTASPVPNKGRRKIKSAAMPVDMKDPRVEALADEVRRLNDYWSGQSIAGADHEGFFRKFHMGDDQSFDWNKGGRLYSLGGGYQNMPRDQRPNIQINGQPTVEIDIAASHLTILHGLEGVPLKQGVDPYTVPGLPREIVKGWVAMTLGHTGFHHMWTTDNKKRFLKNDGRNIQEVYPIRKVQKLILEYIPLLKGWENSACRWADFQFFESKVLIKTMLRLMTFNIPALPLHDSIIVPVIGISMSRLTMMTMFKNEVGYQPALKVK